MEIGSRTSTHKWNRTILNFLWGALILIIVAECFSAIPIWNEPGQLKIFFYTFMVKQNLTILLVNILAETFLLFIKKGFAYMIIFTASCISFAILLNAPNHGADVAIVLPVLISILYFNYVTVIYASVLSSLLVIVLQFMNTGIIHEISGYEVILVTGLIFSTTAVSLGIVRQGNRLVRMLRDKLQSEEELNVQKMMMEKLIMEDALTGVYNHKAFHQCMEQALMKSESEHLSFHLALIDIDNFKHVNDTYGHAVGDVVIRSIAQMLIQLLQDDDIISRYGGEEYAVIMMNRDTDTIKAQLESIRMEIEAVQYPEMNNKQVTVSIGLHPHVHGEGKEHTFKQADAALYTAKKTGKNKIICRD